MGRDYQTGKASAGATSVPERTDGLGVGKRTLVEATYGSAVQRKETGTTSNADVHAAAERGTAGPGAALPHAETIQRSFGRHDVSGVRAHTDNAAQQASQDMGAKAFATGNHVAFGSTPISILRRTKPLTSSNSERVSS